jgi:hypothetical protein
MTLVTIERYPAPSTARAARRLERAGSRAADRLAGRKVWCATSLTAGRDAALALCDCLLWARESGVATSALATAQLVEEKVRQEDVVVLHDPPSETFAEAIRERGAHVVWRIGGPGATDRLPIAAVDVYLMSWLEPERGSGVERIAALVPSPGALTASDVAPGPAAERRHDLGWSSALASAIAADRADTVGGTRRVRPRVAAR